jgi:hypothetical protein
MVPRTSDFFLRCEVLTAVKMSTVVFWAVTPASTYMTTRHRKPGDLNRHPISFVEKPHIFSLLKLYRLGLRTCSHSDLFIISLSNFDNLQDYLDGGSARRKVSTYKGQQTQKYKVPCRKRDSNRRSQPPSDRTSSDVQL